MAMDEKGLGRRLQNARVHAGLTQQALCQHAGISYSTLTKIERGAISSPSIFTIQRIAGALQLGLDELMGMPAKGSAPKLRSKNGVRFVYFDINGCLVRFFHRAFARLGEETSASPDAIETVFWKYNDQVCRGDMDMATFNRTLAEQLKCDSVDWMAYYMEAIEPIEAMREMVAWTAERYHVGLLTNIMPGFVTYMRNKKILPDVTYDAIVDSSEVKAIKPEAKIYDIAAQKAHCSPTEILLIDDSRVNLMAAGRHDWHVLWFDDYRPEESVKRIKATLEPEA